MATNLELLEQAGLINANNMPSANDVMTINSLTQADVQGLINVYHAVNATFLVNNCNPGGTVAPGPARAIGIVF
jgi:hypothetical protein